MRKGCATNELFNLFGTVSQQIKALRFFIIELRRYIPATLWPIQLDGMVHSLVDEHHRFVWLRSIQSRERCAIAVICNWRFASSVRLSEAHRHWGRVPIPQGQYLAQSYHLPSQSLLRGFARVQSVSITLKQFLSNHLHLDRTQGYVTCFDRANSTIISIDIPIIIIVQWTA